MSEHDLRKDENASAHEQNDEVTRDNALFISKWKVKTGETLEFPIQGREGEIVIDWGDGSHCLSIIPQLLGEIERCD